MTADDPNFGRLKFGNEINWFDDADDLTTRFISRQKLSETTIPISPPLLFLVVRVVRVVRNAHEIDVCWLTTRNLGTPWSSAYEASEGVPQIGLVT
jgi:hypothetical protein